MTALDPGPRFLFVNCDGKNTRTSQDLPGWPWVSAQHCPEPMAGQPGEGRPAPAPASHKLLSHTAKGPGHRHKTCLTRNPSRKSSKSNAVLSRVGVEVAD